MTRDEVMALFRRIKANYSTFRSDNLDVIEEWAKKLSEYDCDEINENLIDYIEYEREEPKLCDLTFGLKKLKNKSNIKATYVCSTCGKKYNSLEKCNECYELDRTLSYITKMSDLLGINANEYFKPYYTRCSVSEINRNYNDWILRVVEEQKKNPLLKGRELESLRSYYKHVILKK